MGLAMMKQRSPSNTHVGAEDEVCSEEWRPVEGFPRYEVSDLGRIRRAGTGRLMAVRYSRRRYGAVHFPAGDGSGRYVDFYIHRLVAAAFIGPRPEGKEVNHKDGNRRHNAVSNLEYCTRSENIRHAGKIRLLKSAKGGRRVLPDFARFAL